MKTARRGSRNGGTPAPTTRAAAAAPARAAGAAPARAAATPAPRTPGPRKGTRTASAPAAPVPGGDDGPGRSYIGRYEILERIGIGGMAEAFRARASGPGGYARELIVKSILPDFADDKDFVRLFVAEAKILGMLNHPNIVQVYDFGEHDGRLFLVLEYLDGPSVSEILSLLAKAQMPMPVAVAAFIAREMCLGLGAAHGLVGPKGEPLNVVHRDVTPSNVMTTTAGEVKLVDFGIAKLGSAGTSTRGGTIRGKPAYMSPEQVLGAPVDGRSDLFTTGAVLYEMLTLKPLFLGENDLATIYKIMEHEIPPPSTVRKGVPPEMDEIVARALTRPPAKRYQSAREMADDLTKIVNKASVGREEISAFATMWKRLKSKRVRPPVQVTVPPPDVDGLASGGA